MPSVMFNTGKTIIPSVDFDAATNIKMLLIGTHTADPAPTLTTVAAVLDGTARAELATITGYTGGHAGAGRRAITGVTYETDQTNNRCEIFWANQTWTALATGHTIRAALLFQEGAADTSSVPIAFFDLADVTTNGGDFTLTVGTDGALQLA